MSEKLAEKWGGATGAEARAVQKKRGGTHCLKKGSLSTKECQNRFEKASDPAKEGGGNLVASSGERIRRGKGKIRRTFPNMSSERKTKSRTRDFIRLQEDMALKAKGERRACGKGSIQGKKKEEEGQ